MDVNQAYGDMIVAWHAGDMETAQEYAGNIVSWVEHGGFCPIAMRDCAMTILAFGCNRKK